jgi:hypothetical protein
MVIAQKRAGTRIARTRGGECAAALWQIPAADVLRLSDATRLLSPEKRLVMESRLPEGKTRLHHLEMQSNFPKGNSIASIGLGRSPAGLFGPQLP